MGASTETPHALYRRAMDAAVTACLKAQQEATETFRRAAAAARETWYEAEGWTKPRRAENIHVFPGPGYHGQEWFEELDRIREFSS